MPRQVRDPVRTARCVVMIVSLFVLSGIGCQGGDPPAAREITSEPTEVVIPKAHVEGANVYAAKCGLCHDRGDEGAPRLGNPRQWAKRVVQSEETLVQHALEGFEGMWGEMPAQGDDLTEAQVTAAVRYMVYRHEQAAMEE